MLKYQALLKERGDLLDKRAALATEARRAQDAAEAAGRDLTEAEQARDDVIVAELKAGNARLDALKVEIENEEIKREALRTAPVVESVRDLGLEKPWGQQWRQAGASPDVIKNAAFGEKLAAVRRAALGQGVDPRLTMEAVAQGAGEAIDADGGYLVSKEVAVDILVTATGGEVLSRVSPYPVGPNKNGLTLKVLNETSRATGSRFGAVRGYWVDEGGSPTASRPKLREVELKLKKLGALGYASDELLEDAVAFGAIMTYSFGQELRFLAEDAVINGDGAGKPLGVVGHAATVSVAKETGQAAASIVFENIQKMWARLWAPARAGAVWFINQDAEPQLNAMSLVIGTGGVPVYLPPGGIADTPFARLMGRPVIPIEYCQTVGTVGDIVLANLEMYAFITKGGVRQDSSMHVAFTTDEMAFRAIWRVDGQPKWAAALTPFKGTNTLSPVVTLATRS